MATQKLIEDLSPVYYHVIDECPTCHRQCRKLSPREKETVKWLLQGLSDREIGMHMGIGCRIVKAYLKNVCNKLYLNYGKLRRESIVMHFFNKPGIYNSIVHLTLKEKGIIRGIAKGLYLKEIAAEQNTSEGVIKNYLKVMYDKTGMTGRMELLIWALTQYGKELNFDGGLQ